MNRRKFLVGVGSAAAAGSAVLGSGAFTRVEAQRSVTVQVAEDPNAYLGMDTCRSRWSPYH
ncbi:MAG: twin-arginine translocation signal domain-containing protein [Halovenus sp.]